MTLEGQRCYQEALKQGQKEFKNCIHRGQYPYIQSLSQIQEEHSRLTRTELGLLEVPLYLIAGSAEDQRCSSFSPGFYPLMDPRSEFAGKWANLCDHQIAEGIHDPIKCFEYLGRFYVIEGNKRVSVLNYLGGASIWANVTRLLPRDEDNITVRIYREFLRFYDCARFYGVHFSDLGGYARLQAALGFAQDEVWPEEFRKKFLTRFLAFRSCFHKLGGGGLSLTTGDALLRWLRFYGAERFLAGGETDYRQTLSAIWRELIPAGESGMADVREGPEEEKKSGAVSGLVGLLTRPRTLRVAFLFQGTPESSPWTATHEEGRLTMEKALGESVSVQTYYNVPAGEGGEGAIQTAVENGAELVFTTTVQLLAASLRAAVKYPKVRIMNCSVNQPYVNVSTYYSRIYEGKFITGAIAGALCRSGRIGYVGSYPILGVPASINAFALGASLTNPEARILLKWHCLPEDALGAFRRSGIELVSNRDSCSGEELAGPLGLFRFGPGGETIPVASPVWKWGAFYIRIVQGMLNGGYRTDERAINYWWGMSAGAVDVLLDDGVPESVRALADILRMGLQNGTVRPFRRRVAAQDGAVKNDGGRDLTMDEILRMDWLCDRVEGTIPNYGDLLPVARSTVRLLGVRREDIPPEEGAL